MKKLIDYNILVFLTFFLIIYFVIISSVFVFSNGLVDFGIASKIFYILYPILYSSILSLIIKFNGFLIKNKLSFLGVLVLFIPGSLQSLRNIFFGDLNNSDLIIFLVLTFIPVFFSVIIYLVYRKSNSERLSLKRIPKYNSPKFILVIFSFSFIFFVSDRKELKEMRNRGSIIPNFNLISTPSSSNSSLTNKTISSSDIERKFRNWVKSRNRIKDIFSMRTPNQIRGSYWTLDATLCVQLSGYGCRNNQYVIWTCNNGETFDLIENQYYDPLRRHNCN